MIDLYFWPTPNGKKVTILLEECAMEYNVVPFNIGKGDQFTEEFLRFAPNNRMPAMIDNDPIGGGEPLSIFESGAMMMYIAEKAEMFWPQDTHQKYEIAQWVMWQMANQGPKLGECGNFRRRNEEVDEEDYGVRRFTDEANRLYGVLNNRLYDRRYLAGDQYSIADMICYPWCMGWKNQGQNIDDFKYFKRWFEELGERPGVQRGMAVGSDMGEDYSKVTKEERTRRQALLMNQRARPAPETGSPIGPA